MHPDGQKFLLFTTTSSNRQMHSQLECHFQCSPPKHLLFSEINLSIYQSVISYKNKSSFLCVFIQSYISVCAHNKITQPSSTSLKCRVTENVTSFKCITRARLIDKFNKSLSWSGVEEVFIHTGLSAWKPISSNNFYHTTK